MEVCPIAQVVPGLLFLDALQTHPQLLHEADGLHAVYRLRKNLVVFSRS